VALLKGRSAALICSAVINAKAMRYTARILAAFRRAGMVSSGAFLDGCAELVEDGDNA